MVRPQYTVKPSRVSENICKKHLVGLAAEDKVKTLFENKGYQLVQQRHRTPFGEIDLLFKKKHKHYLMVEVKSRNKFVYLSRRQKLALRKSYEYLMSRYKEPILFYLALVEGNKVYVLPEDLSI